MFWQREYVREGVSMSLNETYKLDLPEHGLLGSLLIRISGSQVSPYGQGEHDWRIIDKISKIAVLVDGAVNVKSLTGYQVKALEYYDQGILAPGDWRNYASNTQFEYLLVNFGRWLQDADFGLDLSRFNNVELQVTNTATSAKFTDLTISVLGVYLRDAPASQFRGHLKTEEWRSWTTVSDETKYNDLPVEHLLRRVMLQAIPDQDADFVNESNMSNLMDDVELSLNTGATRVYKGGIDDLMRENALFQGRPAFVGGQSYMLADDGIDISLGRVIGFVGGSVSKDGAGSATIPTLMADELSGTLKPETYEADSPINVFAFGFAPFYTAVFDFEVGFDPMTWLDPNARKTVKLDIHTRSGAAYADGRNAIVLDRLARYL
jgi:hypothetical protein